MVIMYTDGSSRGNPGPGGYGVVLKYGNHRKEISEGFRKTTNNRMELLAVIKGLEALKRDGLEVTIYSDSKYVVEAVEKGWLWDGSKKDLRIRKTQTCGRDLFRAYKRQRVKFKWVKGHAGIPENERCDQLAVQSAESSNLRIDSGFENS